jgi:hypothetical protein
MSGSLTTNSSGIAILNLGAVRFGNYTLTISRSATPTISSVSTNSSLTIYKAKPALTISPHWLDNAVAGQTYTFTTSLANNATKSMITVPFLSENVYINNILYGSFQTNLAGNSTFSWKPATAGQYNITVVFPRQNYYTPTQVTTVISVAHRSVVLAVSNSPTSPNVNQPVTWNVVVYDLISNATVKSLPVNQYIDGALTPTSTTDSTGTATFTYRFPSTALHNVTFVSAMNGTYSSATVHGSINAFWETKLKLLGPSTITVGQQNAFTISLNDSNGNPLSSRTIQITVGGVSYQNVTTLSNGQAQFTWRPDNTGMYSIGASFLAAGSTNFGYKASSGGLSVSVIPKTTINIQTLSGGTQSVTFNTAQGSTQPSIPPPSISITFPDGAISLSIGYNGKSAQASATLSNKFGWNCQWWGCLPYWNVEIGASVSALFSFLLTGAGLGLVTGVNTNINTPPSLDPELIGRGLDASIIVAITGLAAFYAQPEVPPLAGAIVMTGMVTATLAGAFLVQNGNTMPYKSYLFGLMIAPFVGFVCKFARCPDVPSVPGFELGLAGLAWLAYLGVGIFATWALGGWIAALEVAFGFLLPALLLSLM